MQATPPYKIFFIGDSAATIDFGNIINEDINKKAISLFNYLSQHPLEGTIEAIPAYSSVTIYVNVPLLRKKISPEKKVYEWVTRELHKIMLQDFEDTHREMNVVRMPVCYEDEFAPDIHWLAGQNNISAQDIIRIHTSRQYRVYMLGFLPGFAYMAEVDDQIAVPRKPQPQWILAGSVGIAGKQTGIYPLNSPGGWQIIGRTPSKMFDKERAESCLLKAGDFVKFYPITRDEFEDHQGGRI
jgi:TIGR00370 family protein